MTRKLHPNYENPIDELVYIVVEFLAPYSNRFKNVSTIQFKKLGNINAT